jgi:uncharacterized protein (TIGR02453 family)
MKKLNDSLRTFLVDLKANNNRDWFAAHKPQYQEEYQQFKTFSNTVLEGMQSFDVLEAVKIFRIYRDVRFSANKMPYKPHFSFWIKREGMMRRGGYYVHIEPGNCFLGGGFWAPESADLKHIRKELAADPDSLRNIIQSAHFKNHFGSLQGDQLKSAPQGFPKDHPAIDLLKYKQYLAMKKLTDQEVWSSAFFPIILETFEAMLPFFNYMSEVLGTDENGVPLSG